MGNREADRRKRAGLRVKETPESGTKGSKSDRRIKAKRNRWLRGVGEHLEGLGVERSAKARPAGSLHGLKGRTGGGAGKLRPAARSGVATHSPLCSPRNTSLNFLSGFPKSPPADMMEPEELPPLQPRDLPDRRYSNRLMKRVKGRAPSSLGPSRADGGARLGGRTALHR